MKKLALFLIIAAWAGFVMFIWSGPVWLALLPIALIVIWDYVPEALKKGLTKCQNS